MTALTTYQRPRISTKSSLDVLEPVSDYGRLLSRTQNDVRPRCVQKFCRLTEYCLQPFAGKF